MIINQLYMAILSWGDNVASFNIDVLLFWRVSFGYQDWRSLFSVDLLFLIKSGDFWLNRSILASIKPVILGKLWLTFRISVQSISRDRPVSVNKYSQSDSDCFFLCALRIITFSPPRLNTVRNKSS